MILQVTYHPQNQERSESILSNLRYLEITIMFPSVVERKKLGSFL